MSRRLLWTLIGVTLVAWLALAAVAGPYAGKLTEVQSNDNTTFLPSDAESTRVSELQAEFRSEETTPGVLVIEREEGLTREDRQWAAGLVQRIASDAELRGAVVGEAVGPVPSEDGQALQIVVPFSGDLGERLDGAVERVRDLADEDIPEDLDSHLTGPAGFTADLGSAFAGIDGVLLAVALGVVLLILLTVYRSPILPLTVLLAAVFALALASGAVYLLADADVLTLDGQSQGILFILVVGAATDYALLLVARYREELREHESRLEAMRIAWRQSFWPILASGTTVILALLCLLVSNLNSTRSLGPVAAIGLAASLLSALTFLPAALGLLGRAAFWPARPRYGSEHPERSGLWGRIAGTVGHRPRATWVVVTLVLVALTAFLPTLRAGGTSQSDVFLNETGSVAGQQVLTEHFPGGSGSPAVIIGPAAATTELVGTVRDVDGVASAEPVGRTDGLVQVQAVLADPYDSAAARDTVERLREAVSEAVPEALVGGQTAIDLDTLDTAKRDRALVIPLVLLVVFLLLALLLRAVVAAALLLGTVVLSFAATLGAAAILFNLLGLPEADPSVPLYGFVFLVALGVDYNIFLMTRAREESARSGTRDGVLRALAVTGGVITSAGIVLAATFSALLVIPLVFLAQLAFIVAFGVLLDTLVVRSLLVPAASIELRRWLWWPGRPGSGISPGSAPARRG